MGDELRIIVSYYPLPPFVVARKGTVRREGLTIDFAIATLAPEHNRECSRVDGTSA